MNHKLQYRTEAGIVVYRQGYPWEPDPPEPETELAFCHADLRPEDDCGGDFHKETISVGKDKQQVFWKCDECQMLMTKDELITLAAESYGHDWERQCTRVLPEEEPYYI